MITMTQTTEAVKTLQQFIGKSQMQAMADNCRGEEREYFKAKFVEMATIVANMPKTYEQDGKGDNAIVYLHYFTAGADWFIYEKDIEAEQHQAFGLADIYGDGGELGYISIVELLEAGAELDLHFTPITLYELKKKRNK